MHYFIVIDLSFSQQSFSFYSITVLFCLAIDRNQEGGPVNIQWTNQIWKQTCSSLLASLFLIHSFPCVWGSMRSGKRAALVTMMPFWMERSSFGSPCKREDKTNMERFVSASLDQNQSLQFVDLKEAKLIKYKVMRKWMVCVRVTAPLDWRMKLYSVFCHWKMQKDFSFKQDYVWRQHQIKERKSN